METEHKSELTAEAFAIAMFNYVLPRRFNHNIPRTFGTGEHQLTEVHFRSNIGEAVLLTCYVHRNSFLNRFSLEYPEHLADAHTFAAYFRRYALELYEEENVINSLLIVSAILIEMVSYCSMPSVKNGNIFINSVDKCWSSIFVNQFERTFLESGGWFALQKISQEKAQIYDQIKREYPSYSNEDIPFHHWIDDEDPGTPKTSVLEAGYSSIENRINQILQSDRELQSVFQQIIDSNDKFELKADSIQQHICASGNDPTSVAQASDSLSKLSFQESKDLKSGVSVTPDNISDHVSTSMDVDDSNMERKTHSETKSTELGAIPETFPKTDAIYQNERNMEITCPLKLIEQFKDTTYDANMTHGIYFDGLFKNAENFRLLTNDKNFLKMMKHAVNNTGKLNTIPLIIEAKRIIEEDSSATKLNSLILENQPTNTSVESNDVLGKAFDALNIQEKPEKDNLLLAGKVNFTAKMEIQHKEYPARQQHSKMGHISSTGKEYRLKSTVLNTVITTAYLKTSIETALRTMKNKQCAVSHINERRKDLYAVIDKKYIIKVLQHLNFELGTTFPEIDTLELDDLTFPYTEHGTGIMKELMNFGDTFDRIQDLEFLPDNSLTRYLKENLKAIISGRAGIRIAISTLENLRFTPLDELNISQYYRELIRILICEYAYFIQLQEKLQELKERLMRDDPSRIRNQSSPQSSAADKVSPKYPSEADNRKRRKSSSEEGVDCSPSKHAMVDTSAHISLRSSAVGKLSLKFSSEADNRKKRKSTTEEEVACSPSKHAMVDTIEYSTDSVVSPKSFRLPADNTETPVQISVSHVREENVEESLDSGGNEY